MGVCLIVAGILAVEGIAIDSFGVYLEGYRGFLFYGIGVIALGGSVANAYLNDGLIVSTAIPLAIALGYGLATIVLSSFGILVTDTPPELLFIYFASTLAVIGIGAFGFGVGLRRVVDRLFS